MRISGVSNISYTPRIVAKTVSQQKTPIMTKEQMAQLLSFMTYQQNNMNLKLVRIAGALYSGKKIDQAV
ncbi:hypothetical protein SU69_04820 [Thermosipho melanesiensis]|uniref:Uncharacterized protein n=2 Tax=Thermosipho melanesiensis TaxID=46541 RepID=A6LLK2_THEM4|nr:hypothetical protein [Thermosipho melanesiensis]ABR30803.1 hypothetical protein Tmel_0942 [Thermosipho melanesiensis BI429]APT73923.1 hypothetical protein BW47_05055 [Thermosipho melanesiensis]OOC35861.1 hypothetical protein SU68_04875 [Thermosipho melanesiensis]OOC38363.1 hypothetical protein SU69_04820 [Thermosipho melanesiensis]OOC38824.1 hypothetical protein SU70_04820 [Thermosipho melanesiensis]